jgi:gluconokinase
MKNLGLRSPCEKVGGIVYFGRMIDQIRAQANGELPPEYQGNLGKGLEEHCVNFLGVTYDLVVQFVNEGLSDGAILQSCFGMGHRPSQAEIYMWNEFMRKRGWNDELSETLESQKKKGAMLSRSEIQTAFQFIDADEGRSANGHYVKATRTRKRVTIPATEWPPDLRRQTASTPLKTSAHQKNEPNQQRNRIPAVLQWLTFDAVIRAYNSARASIPIARRMAARH